MGRRRTEVIAPARHRSAARQGRFAAAVCLGAAAIFVPPPTYASSLLAPAVGAADNATMGTRIADPHTPAAALFENPAGLTGFETLTNSVGLGIGYGRAQVQADVPAGYDETNTNWPVIPDFGLSLPLDERWRFAIGSYGSTGSTFDFPAPAGSGDTSFFAETIILAFPLGAAYRINDQLSLGAELQPLFGQLRAHFPLPGVDFPFKYKINGPGVQGMLGMTVRPTAQWAFGLSVRTPGMIWMGGSMPVPGAGRQRVSVDLEMPTQVFLGATWHCLPQLTLSGSVRFTNSSTLGDSTIKYALTPMANSGFVPDANDEWKFALAAEYAMRQQTVARLGIGWSSHIVGAHGVSPLVFDDDDTKIAAGVGQTFGRWVLDATVGYVLPAERHVAPALLPGAYSMQGGMLMLEITYAADL